jgi:hypothetical protein
MYEIGLDSAGRMQLGPFVRTVINRKFPLTT